MKIGIVVYSQTGNTLSVAEKLKERLAARGHAVSLEKIAVMGDASRASKEFRFEKLPVLDKFEALVFAAPVQGFSLCQAMSAYLPLLPSLSGKKIACFVTKRFSNDWTGGSSAVSSITKAVKDKNGNIIGSGVVHWGKRKDEEVEALIENFCGLF